MIYFLLLTAFTVSIDSFVCGFSLALLKGKKIYIVLTIAVTVFIMCLITNFAATLLSGFLTEKTANLGGLLLIFVGIYNLFKKDTEGKKNTDDGFLRALTTGIAVGLDGAMANLSLSLMGLNQIYVPIIIASMHALMITFGILLSKTTISKKIMKFGFVPPLILIMLGTYKVLCVFI